MYQINLSKVPVSGINMDTDIYVIDSALSRSGLGGSELSRDDDTADFQVFHGGRGENVCVIRYNIQTKSISFVGEEDKYVKSILCVNE